MLKKLGLSVIALVSTILIANAISGNQLGLPIIGGDTYCSSFGNNSVCSNTVAAGPSLTGSETIIANTNIGGSGGVQTGVVPLPALGAGLLSVQAPTAGDTITLSAVTRQLIVAPTTTIATLGVTFPSASASMQHGQRIGVCSTQTVTAVTMSAGTGNTFSPAVVTALAIPGTTGAGTCYEWTYSKTSATAGVWYRAQ